MAKKRFIAVSVRQMVAERANWRCEYCQSPEDLAPQSFTLEHIVPSSQGGSDDLDNLAYACQGCNSSKYVKTKAQIRSQKKLYRFLTPAIKIGMSIFLGAKYSPLLWARLLQVVQPFWL